MDWITQQIDDFTTRFFGLSFTLSNVIVLAVFFMFGFYFGKLTKNMTFLKFLLFLFLGLHIYAFLHAAHFMIIWAFVLGMVANHGRLILRTYYWAYDFKDVVFAMRYRRAFDDIRRREEELEERIRQFQQEQEAFNRRKAQADRKTSNSNHKRKTERRNAQPPPKAKPKSYQDQLREKHLRTLGLDPTKSYNPDQIRKAYRMMAKKTHPDTGGSHEAFIEVQKAYEWLGKIVNRET